MSVCVCVCVHVCVHVFANMYEYLHVSLHVCWRQHPTKQQLYGHLPPITKYI